MQERERILREHPFFANFEPKHIQLLACNAQNCRFEEGQYLFREGDPSDKFFLIRDGMAALEVAVPGKTPVVLEALNEGKIASAAWLAPPYVWAFDGRAVTLIEAIGIDAGLIRLNDDAYDQLARELTKRLLTVLTHKVVATRPQFLNLDETG
jgi:CRP/FNR family cyclic AMP-dependent transcriptional regulator